MTKKISIIVSAYNEQDSISDCLSSLVSVDYPIEKYEIIIVNDGSTDKTLNVIKEYSKKYKQIKVFSKSNGGKGSAQNLGIKKSKGEIVAITDSDCVVSKNWLKLISDNLYSNVYVQGPCLPRNSTKILEKVQYSEFLVKVKYASNTSSYISGANNAFRKELIEDIGLFSEKTLNPTQDFINRIKSKGYAITFSADMKVYTIFESNLINYIKQKLRWRVDTSIKSIVKTLASNIGPFFFTHVISWVQFIGIIYFIYFQNYQMILLLLSLSFFLELIVRLEGLFQLIKSQDSLYIFYFCLHTILSVLFVRNLLPPYFLCNLVFGNSKPTFNA